MRTEAGSARSALVSRVLAGSWRSAQLPELDLSEPELDEVTPLLYGSGAAALGWWRVRKTILSATPSATVLRQAYRLQSLQCVVHEEKITKIFRRLRAASIEPILIKGWAAAGLYPDPALRPYGDIDLLVREDDYQRAIAITTGPDAKDCWVDLHSKVAELADRSVAELFERSRSIDLGAEKIRVLSPEDHISLLAIHLLKHGAWRPLWLCDIGAAIESLPEDFDWQLCLGKDGRRAGWITSAIGLAHDLLGARLDSLAIEEQERNLPEWLRVAVLRQWQQPFATNQPPMKHPLPIVSQFREPGGLIRALCDRWPNPILATISVNGKFNQWPRFPYQVANCLVRVGQFLLRLPQVAPDD